jgi:hypothetical protein
MCYLVAKKVNSIGSLALQTSHGQHLVNFKKKIIAEVDFDKIQLVTISRPSAYGEYEPYQFVDTEQEFEQKVKAL